MTFAEVLAETHFVVGERGDRYLRAFERAAAGGPDEVYAVARDAIRFVADDAFRRGFEACHENIVAPLRERSISKDDAVGQMRRHGRQVQLAISAALEDEGTPTGSSEAVAGLRLPEPKLHPAVAQ